MDSDGSITPQSFAALEPYRGLSPAALGAVAAAARIKRLPKDLLVFSQGDEGVRAHAIIEGSVRITQSGSDGEQVVVRFIGRGEMFGTVALFTDGKYPAEAVTLTETLEASWSEAELLELIARHPQIAINIIRILGKRLREVQERARELATQRAERRVAHALLRLSRQAGRETDDGTVIAFPLRRKDVAHISGTTLHTASRILTAWGKAGFLVTHDQHLTIRRPAEIRRIAEDAVD
jgi:CRP-like cAMP-binding protein